MIPLTEQHHHEIADVCRRYAVRRLDLFGSAAADDVDPSTSDVDFFYQFENVADVGLADRYFELQDGWEALPGLPVELVSAKDARNRFFSRSRIATGRRSMAPEVSGFA